MQGRFSIVRRGYCPEEVDEYIDSVRDYLTQMEAKHNNCLYEIDSLKKSVEDFRQKEASINNALVSSQISADGILMNARSAADSIVKDAKNEAAATKQAMNRLLSDIVVSLHPHRDIMQSFRHDYEELVSVYLKEIDEHEFSALGERFDALENFISGLTSNE